MGAIKFPHASGNSMSIAAPATNPASDLELKLPATIGTANQYLKNSGTAGTLEFGSLTAGKIIQVVGLDMKDTESRATSSHDWGQLGDIATITMVGTGSKVIVQSWLNVSSDNTTGRYGLRMAVTYPDTAGASSSDLLIVGGAEGNRQRATLAYRQNSGADFANMGFNWLLTPATSIPAGDRIQFYWSSSGEDTNTIYLNRTKDNDNNNTQYRPTSGFCLMEVSA